MKSPLPKLSNYHPWLWLWLPSLGLITTLQARHNHEYLLISMWMVINLRLITPTLNWRTLLRFNLCLIPVIAAIFVSSYGFAVTPQLSYAESLNARLTLSLNLSLRLWCLANTSFMFLSHAHLQQIGLELMARRYIPAKIGFALLAVANAQQFLKSELNRIQMAYSMRYHKPCYSPRIILPLLIAAARYAHSLSLSAYSRGLNNQRSYLYRPQAFKRQDWLIAIFNLGICLFLCLGYPRHG